MADDVILNKAAAIERAVRRAREEYDGNDANLLSNQTRQGCWSRRAESIRSYRGA